MRRFLSGSALALALGVWIAAGPVCRVRSQATPPVQTEPAKDSITAEAGPWVICAASYTGLEAAELAQKLAYQIRTRYNLPAYVFNRGEAERKKLEKEEMDRLQAQFQAQGVSPTQRRRTIRVEDQCAVLVGGYKDMETARKALDGIKKLPLPEIKLSSGKPALDEAFIADEKGQPTQRAYVNPFQTAFVTRNPALPSQAAASRKFDPIWEKLNRYEEYNLLSAPHPWTMVVKVYSGTTLVQSQAPANKNSFLGSFWPGSNKPGEALGAAGMQAHELAKVLRQLNFQAYVLHTRTNSIVTVGAFNRPDEPDVSRVRQQLASLRQRLAAGGRDPMQLYPDPLLCEVPRP